MRRSTALWCLVALATVVGMQLAKQNVRALDDEFRTVNAAVAANREAINVLRAEWVHLNRPSRLERLGRSELGLETVSPRQILSVESFLAGRQNAAPESAVGAIPVRSP